MYIALYQPEIAPNTGNIARTCAAAGCPLHLSEPLGFSLSDRQLKRAGLDYWPHVDLTRHRSWGAFVTDRPAGRLVSLSVRGVTELWEMEFLPEDILLFGSESRGLPPEVLAEGASVRIPMGPQVRSLNLAVSVGIVLYEALRQQRNLCANMGEDQAQ